MIFARRVVTRSINDRSVIVSNARPLQAQTSVQESEIESLARETKMSVATVRAIWEIEHAKLDQVAKIKTYVPVLIRRRVKELLRNDSKSARR